MDKVPDLLRAIAALLWPVFAFVTLFLFKNQVRDLVSRLRKGKVFGQEIELRDKLSELESRAEEASAAVEALPPASEPTPQKNIDEADTEKHILNEAARSPKAALLLLASALEREVRQILASLGLLESNQRPLLFHAGLEILEKRGGLPKSVTSSAKLFYTLRSKLIHGRDAKDDETLAAVDSGLTILRALNAIPREKNFVYHPGVQVFADPLARDPREGVKGLILETTSPGGASTSRRIFPTTRTDYAKGQRVSWEWNLNTVIGQSWYKDPDSGEIREAWREAGEFVGRDLTRV